MKKISKYFMALSAAVALAVGLPACQDDVKAPGVDIPTSKLVANTTLLELKTEFWDAATNYAKVIENADDPSQRYIIKGRVISSDEEGNIFKSLVIQDETAALAFSIDSYNLYLNYRVGQEIVMDVTGMTIGKYAGLQQMGRKSYYENGKTDQVSFMASEEFQLHAELNGLPAAAEIDTLSFDLFTPIMTQTDEVLMKYQSQLVRFNDVTFANAGKEPLSVYHTKVSDEQNQTVYDRAGNQLIVRTSGYATFFNIICPKGTVDIVGILSYYNNNWQLYLIDEDGIIPAGTRPGSKDNPYSVAQAIKEEADGIDAKGWVKGYIVGCLAPEVEEVASNADIQWVGDAPFITSQTLVIAPSATTTDYSECMVVLLPSDSKFQKFGNLNAHPENIGKEILVYGNFTKYLGTWGLTGNSGATDEFEIEGVDASGVVNGDGTEASPYSVAQALSIINSGNIPTDQVYVKGIISSIKEIDTGSFGNATYYIKDDGGAETLGVYRGYWLNGDKFTSADQLAAGAEVVVKGTLVNYMGNTPQFAQGNQVVSYNGSGSGSGDTPSGPVAEGEGTEASPYNVTKALQVINSGNIPEAEVYATGYIASIKEVSTSFGNATYYIKDENGTETLGVYRGYWLGGEKFTAENQIAVGGKVVVKGTLVNYMGNTPQFATGNSIVSYDGSTAGGGDTPGGDDPVVTPPAEAGDPITINMDGFKGAAASSGFNIISPATIDGYTFTTEKASGATAPAVYVYDNASTVRLYANNTFKIEGSTNIAMVVFTINTATGAKRYTTLTPSSGAMAAQATGDTQATWTGNTKSVTFTVGATSTLGTEAGKPGQFHISGITIYPAK